MSTSRRTLGEPQELDLVGLWFAEDREGHAIYVENGDELHLPLFYNQARLALFLHEVLGPGVIVAHRIADTWGFLNAVPGEIQVVINPCKNDDGRWQYLKVLRD